MKPCPYCGTENAPETPACKSCGTSLTDAVEPPPVGAEPEARTVLLRTFASLVEAQVVADQLESANISVIVGADDCGGLLPVFSSVHGIHLLVKASDLTRAEEALRDIEAEFGIKTTGEAQGTGVPAPAKSTSALAKLGLIALGVLLGAWGSYTVTKWRANYTGTWTDDLNGDTRTDIWWEYKNGVIVKTSEDQDFNGRADRWTFSSQGVAQSSEDDTNEDGKPDVWWTFQHGYVTRQTEDFDFDGKPDSVTRLRGQLPVEATFQISNQLGYWRKDFYTNGVLRVTHLDRDRDGTLDERILFDAFGTFLRVEPMK